ncbi:hypothetical protein SAMN04490243_1490 [Robiginitalea myxolifaciens]|uniref:NIPSNAP protein n=1 Tax=Robiginitalea myxolifaciens TaxID=400055 RepID=A0A1I6GAP4_9FLAO|nr:hypothetical protein [Robiginitalea myxolifaciens]SFR39191.1 hypothetical protein SAMN04490243_1490 [Robiginitalea myxolifaciens]
MKKSVLIIALFLGFVCSAQDTYFTIYNFNVESQDVSTVYDLFDDYFSKNKPEGVMVSLWENHFNDSENNFSHAVVFAGSLDAMGAMYAGGNNDAWNLFLARVNQHMESGFSSAMGRQLAQYGDASVQHPFQRYFLLDVDDMGKWVDSYKEMQSSNNPDGRLNMMGTISAGIGPDGANAWVINGFKDFKTAMAGVGSLRSDAEKEASSKAWEKHQEEGGEVKLVRNGLRILLKTW